MKLLSRDDAKRQIALENNELLESNLKLRTYEKRIIQRLNTIREDYEPEKLKKLRDFEGFCKDLLEKKALLLKEYAGIEKAIAEKKELYYGLIVKQDALEDKMYDMAEKEKKLGLREAFVIELERKWAEKQ